MTEREYEIAKMMNDCYNNRIIDGASDLVWPDGKLKNQFFRLKRTKQVCDCCEAIERERKAVFYIEWGFRQRNYYCQECAEKIAKRIGKPLEELTWKEE